MSRTLVFDVNETLLDLRALDPLFKRAFGDAAVRRHWFGLVLRNAMTVTLTGRYEDFLAIGAASLEMVATDRGVSLDRAVLDAVGETMRNLPAHEDVVPNLERLHEAGFRMAALTNSPGSAARQQLEHAGLTALLDPIMTVEPVRKFKPAPEVYAMAAATLSSPIGQLRMVAAHDWDIAGAMTAGCVGALLLRPGVVRNPLYPAPDIVETDFNRLVDRIIEVEEVERSRDAKR